MAPSTAPSPWAAITRRDFVGWQGLPANARAAELDARFERVAGEGHGFLGSAPVPARFTVYRGEGYPLDLMSWHDDDARLLLVEAELPDLATPPEVLLADLGEPAATADYRWDVLDLAGGVHIHPDRGITIFVGPESQVVRLLLYTRTELAPYLSHLHRVPIPTEY